MKPAEAPPKSNWGPSQELAVAEMVGQLMQFWGFKRPMGRLWTLLYLSPEALTAQELGERLRMSSGALSMHLNELVRWGAVRKHWRPGDRRDFFEAETRITALLQRVVRERELPLLEEAHAVFATSTASLDPADRFRYERLTVLGDLAAKAQSLLDLLRGSPFDAPPFSDDPLAPSPTQTDPSP